MTVLALLGVVLVLFAAAAVATREGGTLADAPQDLPDLALPDGPLRPTDLAALRFSMAPRGYRMSEVDAVLDRLAAELADRDRRLAELGDPLPGEVVSTEIGSGADAAPRAAAPGRTVRVRTAQHVDGPVPGASGGERRS